MKEIKIFIASSADLKKERKEIQLILRKESDKYEQKGVKIKPVLWENLLLDMGQTRKQDYFTEEMLKCDVVIFMFYSKLGKFTKEEFDTAYQNMKDGKNPKRVFVFFKEFNISPNEITEEILKLRDLKKYLEKIEGFYNSFSNIDNLELQLKNQLELLIDNDFKEENKQSESSKEYKSGINIHQSDCENAFGNLTVNGDFNFNPNKSTEKKKIN